jgi:hypothetical protein
MRLLQKALREIEAVVGEFRNVGVEIERAVDRQEPVEARLRQAFDQDFPVVLVAVLDRSSSAILNAASAAICDSVGTEIADCQPRSTHQRSGPPPADAPAGHAEIFRERS